MEGCECQFAALKALKKESEMKSYDLLKVSQVVFG